MEKSLLLVNFSIITTEQYNCPHTHNCTSMTGYHDLHRSKKPKIVCNKNQARKAIQGYPICLTDYDHDFILYEIKLRDKMEYERKQVLMIVANK